MTSKREEQARETVPIGENLGTSKRVALPRCFPRKPQSVLKCVCCALGASLADNPVSAECEKANYESSEH